MPDAKSCAEQIGNELIEGTYVSMIYSAHTQYALVIFPGRDKRTEQKKLKNTCLYEQTFFVNLSKSQNDHYGMKC